MLQEKLGNNQNCKNIAQKPVLLPNLYWALRYEGIKKRMAVVSMGMERKRKRRNLKGKMMGVGRMGMGRRRRRSNLN